MEKSFKQWNRSFVTRKRTAHLPAIDTIAAIAEQYGVVVHPPAGLGTKGATTAPAPADI
jgi:hypothetical protein